MSVHFLCFLFNWRVQENWNQQVCQIKFAENEISNSASHKKKLKKEREEQKHNPTSKK